MSNDQEGLKDKALARYEFKRQIEELADQKGFATELISLYIPYDRQISDVTSYLRNELSQSANIKSKSTRKNVMAAIESIMSRLRYFKQPPKNGVVFFVGHVAVGADQTEMAQFVIEPPERLGTFLYRCDSHFYLDPLKEMLTDKASYGLIVIDRREATIGFVRGKRVETARNFQSRVPSKHSRGGQSAPRFERLIEIAAHEYYKKVGEFSSRVFLDEEDLRGVLVGGPGATKDFFVKKEYLHHEIRNKIVDTFDIGYTDESGLEELVEKASTTLAQLDLMREKKLMRRFMAEVRKPDGGLAAYGEEHVNRALTIGAVDTLLISEGLRKFRVTIECTNCDFSTKTVSKKKEAETQLCPECNSPTEVVDAVDIIREYHERASKMGTKVELISSESREGDMLYNAFGGLVGVLRFKVPSLAEMEL